MEPGHEDREYGDFSDSAKFVLAPQWSPAMKTGNTRATSARVSPFWSLNGARP